MPPILVAVLVGFPIILVVALVYAAYRKGILHERPNDIEEGIRNSDVPLCTPDGRIVMRDLESSGESRKGKEPAPRIRNDVVPDSVAPVAISLEKPNAEIKGLGGGFVKYIKFAKRKKKDDSDGFDGDEEAKARIKGKERRGTGNSKHPELYGGPSRELERGDFELPSLYEEPGPIDISAPKPTYISGTVGRYHSREDARAMVLEDDGRVASMWDKISKHESPLKPTAKSRSRSDILADAKEQHAEQFDEMNLDGGSKVWREDIRPATSLEIYVVGSDSDSDSFDSGTNSNLNSNIEPSYSTDSHTQPSTTIAKHSSEGDDVNFTSKDKPLHLISDTSILTYASTNSTTSNRKTILPLPVNLAKSASSTSGHRTSTHHANFDDEQHPYNPSRWNTFRGSPQSMPSINEIQPPHPYLNRLSAADSGFTSIGSSRTSFDRSFVESDMKSVKWGVVKHSEE